jgi:hypothetical protein
MTAPKPVSQHLILLPSEDTGEPASDNANLADLTDIDPSDPCLRPLPTFTSTQATVSPSLVVPPRGEGKRPQPLDKLKYRNVPFGSGLSNSAASKRSVEGGRDGDVTMTPAAAASQESPKKKKHKKQHGEEQSAEKPSKRKEKRVKA